MQDEADTVGCCSLRVEHLEIGDQSITFDFLGKDSMRYFETIDVSVAAQRAGPAWPWTHVCACTGAVRALRRRGQAGAVQLPPLLRKQEADRRRVQQADRALAPPARWPRHALVWLTPVLDVWQPTTLNKRLNDFMPGLSAKVFRTYNASVTLEKELTDCEITKTTQEKVGMVACIDGAAFFWPCTDRCVWVASPGRVVRCREP